MKEPSSAPNTPTLVLGRCTPAQGNPLVPHVIKDERLESVNRELVEAKAEILRLRDILDGAGVPYQKQLGLFQGNLRK